MLQSRFDFRPQLLASLRQFFGESAFKQRLPALASLNPLLGLVQRKPASPRREWLVRIVGVEFLPKRQRGLLHDVLRVRHIRHQRGNVTKNLPLAPQEQRKKSLLRGILVFGLSRRVWGHASDYNNTSGQLRFLDK